MLPVVYSAGDGLFRIGLSRTGELDEIFDIFDTMQDTSALLTPDIGSLTTAGQCTAGTINRQELVNSKSSKGVGKLTLEPGTGVKVVALNTHDGRVVADCKMTDPASASLVHRFFVPIDAVDTQPPWPQ
jgi:hypothetical protein